MTSEEERLIQAALAWHRHVDDSGLVRADLDATSRALFDAAEAHQAARAAAGPDSSDR